MQSFKADWNGSFLNSSLSKNRPKIPPLCEIFCTQRDKTGPAVKISAQNIFEPFDHRTAAEIRSCDTLLEMGFELRGGGGGQVRKIEGGSEDGQELKK